MPSRLDPFFASVFEQLNQQGLSYRTVCVFLLSQGIVISPQALRSWHLRRSAKIAARTKHSIGLALGPSGNSAPGNIGRVDISRSAQSPLVAFARDETPGAGLAPMQAHIEEEEQKLLLQTTGQGFFPVRRKPTTQSTEQQISIATKWQTLKGIL